MLALKKKKWHDFSENKFVKEMWHFSELWFLLQIYTLCIFQKFLIAMFINTSLLGTCHLICSSYLLAAGYFREFTILVESNKKQVCNFLNWLFWGRNSTDLGLAWWLRVKKVLANAGDMGLIDDPGRSHMPQSNWAHVSELLSPHAATTEAPVAL